MRGACGGVPLAYARRFACRRTFRTQTKAAWQANRAAHGCGKGAGERGGRGLRHEGGTPAGGFGRRGRLLPYFFYFFVALLVAMLGWLWHRRGYVQFKQDEDMGCAWV